MTHQWLRRPAPSNSDIALGVSRQIATADCERPPNRVRFNSALGGGCCMLLAARSCVYATHRAMTVAGSDAFNIAHPT
jgi:hypothetical protein